HPVEVSSPSFQQLFDVALDGQIYAQPLLFPGGLLVATENNHVYVLDPATGAVLVDRALEPPWLAADLGCGDLVPNVGITGPPVPTTPPPSRPTPLARPPRAPPPRPSMPPTCRRSPIIPAFPSPFRAPPTTRPA